MQAQNKFAAEVTLRIGHRLNEWMQTALVRFQNNLRDAQVAACEQVMIPRVALPLVQW